MFQPALSLTVDNANKALQEGLNAIKSGPGLRMGAPSILQF